ncbi:hypothetical protein ACFWZ2_42235 [Streptomyces sp. NPDC059002]|uniref:golvesin C-terminal-like domain-containing protein n=1 Tax=Streptomyces sp. NPDC059002 TaxID=3346690 RepID=UPI00367FBF27
MPAAADADSPKPASASGTDDTPRSAIHTQDRDRLLGKGWRTSGDMAWTTASDAKGFHILTAREKTGYAWKTTASLAEPGFDADAWIGAACVTASGKRAVVVYAPRAFTNKPELMARGGFTAVVNLATGDVTKLSLTASLSYYNPGCGTGETAVLTQSPGEDRAETRLVTVDAATGKLGPAVVTRGQVTSAIPARNGIVAASGARVVSIDGKGRKKTLTKTSRVPYRLTADSHSGIVFLDRQPRRARNAEATTHVMRYVSGATSQLLGKGPQTDTGLARSGGSVYLTGDVKANSPMPPGVQRLPGAGKHASVSTQGKAVVEETAWADGKSSPAYLRPKDATEARAVTTTVKLRATGNKTSFTVRPLETKSSRWPEGREPSPQLGTPKKRRAAASVRAGGRTEIVESERVCSVPRNDPRNQAMQPKPRQVEWAVDQAVTGNLNKHIARPANWKNLGMPAYQPQTLFPNPSLEGGGRVPAQVMLGVTTQESNMWQAARSAVPGVTGNPLIGNYYGIDYYDGNSDNDWDINWTKPDCGYGITQVTDHMRLAGREHGHGGAAWDYQKQRAVALDYATNIAAGLQILVSKWNQTKKAQVVVHDGDPKRLENWFFALWAYNSGFHENTNGNAPWGLGWANNPANPEWDAGRTPFLEDSLGNENASDAAHPQHWPYPEKVLGFAAHPPSFLEAPGKLVPAFRPAWWNGTGGNATVPGSAMYHRAKVKPPEDLFCGPYNSCDPSKIGDGAENETGAGPCQLTTGDDKFKCWWHQSVQWKDNCKTYCGNEFMRFDDTYPEEADGTAYAPNCTTAGLPSNAMIIDDVPEGTPSVRPGCGNGGWHNEGTFSLDFGIGESGLGHDGVSTAVWPSKVDLHQLGAGFGGHFYFGHTRKNDLKGNRLEFTGAWKLNKKVTGPAKVLVHLPDHGAHTKYARYKIETAKGTRYRTINQKGDSNRWVTLGAFLFDDAPKVSLSTTARDGTGDDDIAYDAIAIAPVKGKYVEDTVEAFGFFDEDQNIDADPNSTVFLNTPFKSRQHIYDWGTKTSKAVLDLPTCVDRPAPGCAMPETKAAMGKWNTQIKEAGTDPEEHADGRSLPGWLSYPNDVKYRPTGYTKPDWFNSNDSAYKIKVKATVSFVALEDGTVVEGSEFAEYDHRTADTHIPDFVMNTFKSIEKDYGIKPPDLNYTAKNLHEHDGRSTTTDTNTTGILPGRAYAAVGKRPEITNTNGYPASGTDGKCVAATYSAGGSIGYRPMLADDGIQKEMGRWRGEADAEHTAVPPAVRDLMGEIYNSFFKAGKTGSLFNTAPPIWHELSFQSCSDGKIRKRNSEDPGSTILRSSFMPSQYLYRNGSAMAQDGSPSFLTGPIHKGDFKAFSRVATSDGSDMPYAHCAQTSGHGGNPWGIDILDGAGADPEGHTCFKLEKGDPDYSSP